MLEKPNRLAFLSSTLGQSLPLYKFASHPDKKSADHKLRGTREQVIPLKTMNLKQLLKDCEEGLMGVKRRVLLTDGYKTMHGPSQLCVFELEVNVLRAP